MGGGLFQEVGCRQTQFIFIKVCAAGSSVNGLDSRVTFTLTSPTHSWPISFKKPLNINLLDAALAASLSSSLPPRHDRLSTPSHQETTALRRRVSQDSTQLQVNSPVITPERASKWRISLKTTRRMNHACLQAMSSSPFRRKCLLSSNRIVSRKGYRPCEKQSEPSSRSAPRRSTARTKSSIAVIPTHISLPWKPRFAS